MPTLIFFKSTLCCYLKRQRPRGLGSLVQLVLAGAVLRTEGRPEPTSHRSWIPTCGVSDSTWGWQDGQGILSRLVKLHLRWLIWMDSLVSEKRIQKESIRESRTMELDFTHANFLHLPNLNSKTSLLWRPLRDNGCKSPLEVVQDWTMVKRMELD